jgi:DNA topoisomerase-1
MSILVIVESPGKIEKIANFLGSKYIVKASFGIFRDLDPKQMSIDFDHHFEPIYIITKPDVVKTLKNALQKVNMVYLASDEDREGEAIAQSLLDTLKPKNYKRMHFNSITKSAIMEAVEHAGEINKNLVNAQKARRVLDRLYGYLISPLLSKYLGGALSAGRVQSVTVRLIVDKEKEIKSFMKENSGVSYYKVTGIFLDGLKAQLFLLKEKTKPYKGKNENLENKDDVTAFLEKCLKSTFQIYSVESTTGLRSPSPPFTTSTLQQEAVRKLGMAIDRTMRTAQKLYEAGLITYMRTDSISISEEGHASIRKVIIKEFGEEYYQRTNYKNKVANAQEAHECCRPTHPDLLSVEGKVNDTDQIRLYKLIWQRTIASQMKKAKLKITTIQISISKYVDVKPSYYFQTSLEKVIFAGFMKVYVESTEEENGINKNYHAEIPEEGETIMMEKIVAQEEYMKPPSRYTQASLVKKLEELGIGRPSTYVSTIKTIFDRDYVKIADIPGIKKKVNTYYIQTEKGEVIKKIFEEEDEVLLGQEKNKIIPTNLGMTVTEYLEKHFEEMMDYQFTAKMEQELDDISNGDKVWYKVVKKFYDRLMKMIEKVGSQKSITKESEKILGEDKEGNKIYVVKTKFGPRLKKKIGKKFVYTKIEEPYTLDNITLKAAIKMFRYPKLLGEYKGKEVWLKKGEYGFYFVYHDQNYSLPGKNEEITLEDAVNIIREKRANIIKEMEITENEKKVKIVIMNGPYGPYIQVKRKNKKINYPVPKNKDPKELTEEQILEIISKKKKFFKKGGFYKKGSKANSFYRKGFYKKGSKANSVYRRGSKTFKKK